MKIRTKLNVGFGVLFAVVLFFGGMCLYHIKRISESAEVILEDNYESLNYSRSMRGLLDKSDKLSAGDALLFEEALQSEENNVTEKGERERVVLVRQLFERFKTTSTNKGDLERQIRANLQGIDDINMAAIVRKNDVAKSSIEETVMLLQFVGAFTFLVLFSFSVNFPGYVANPLRQLMVGIREISNKNYGQRLRFDSNDEFAELGSAFNDMASKLSQWENSNLATIRSEKMRIEAIIEKMQDAIIGLDEKDNILFINAVAEQLLNLKSDEISSKNAAEVSGTNDLFNYVLKNKKSDKTLKIFANGKESFFQLDTIDISVPYLDNMEDKGIVTTGRSAGSVFILRNITQFKELDQAKTHFIATVSHELKTPISSILMSLDILAAGHVGQLNEDQMELVKNVEEDSNRLLKITGELLDLSQAESGNIQLKLAPANPNEIVQYAIEAVKFQAEQKGIRLEVISRQKNPLVNADIEKSAWVLINFLSNALRYSAEKSRVVVQVMPAGDFVEFTVRDFGKGIELQYQKKLFDRYFQVPTDGSGKSGTGLGLAISKDFIEAQKGEIFVESELGAGSKFGFRLRVQDALL
ncbi:HAMP domain-containing sensor histidine kinase [Desertivirga brevis]|uniref:HAMP domain-containing sensor histidine kinase n=1 Tax=Desertivirga brevis TaxID=2810310 RepID=UPI001A9620C4|nr:ATP-binding protein [Pedobacter sp. SYSU D00873]